MAHKHRRNNNKPYPVFSSCSFVSSDGHRPPKKKIRCRSRRHYTKEVNTEFHDALFSLGTRDRTSRLSNSEFNAQVVSEIGYLARSGASYFGEAVDGVCTLVKSLFE